MAHCHYECLSSVCDVKDHCMHNFTPKRMSTPTGDLHVRLEKVCQVCGHCRSCIPAYFQSCQQVTSDPAGEKFCPHSLSGICEQASVGKLCACKKYFYCPKLACSHHLSSCFSADTSTSISPCLRAESKLACRFSRRANEGDFTGEVKNCRCASCKTSNSCQTQCPACISIENTEHSKATRKELDLQELASLKGSSEPETNSHRQEEGAGFPRDCNSANYDNEHICGAQVKEESAHKMTKENPSESLRNYKIVRTSPKEVAPSESPEKNKVRTTPQSPTDLQQSHSKFVEITDKRKNQIGENHSKSAFERETNVRQTKFVRDRAFHRGASRAEDDDFSCSIHSSGGHKNRTTGKKCSRIICDSVNSGSVSSNADSTESLVTTESSVVNYVIKKSAFSSDINNSSCIVNKKDNTACISTMEKVDRLTHTSYKYKYKYKYKYIYKYIYSCGKHKSYPFSNVRNITEENSPSCSVLQQGLDSTQQSTPKNSTSLRNEKEEYADNNAIVSSSIIHVKESSKRPAEEIYSNCGVCSGNEDRELKKTEETLDNELRSRTETFLEVNWKYANSKHAIERDELFELKNSLEFPDSMADDSAAVTIQPVKSDEDFEVKNKPFELTVTETAIPMYISEKNANIINNEFGIRYNDYRVFSEREVQNKPDHLHEVYIINDAKKPVTHSSHNNCPSEIISESKNLVNELLSDSEINSDDSICTIRQVQHIATKDNSSLSDENTAVINCSMLPAVNSSDKSKLPAPEDIANFAEDLHTEQFSMVMEALFNIIKSNDEDSSDFLAVKSDKDRNDEHYSSEGSSSVKKSVEMQDGCEHNDNSLSLEMLIEKISDKNGNNPDTVMDCASEQHHSSLFENDGIKTETVSLSEICQSNHCHHLLHIADEVSNKNAEVLENFIGETEKSDEECASVLLEKAEENDRNSINEIKGAKKEMPAVPEFHNNTSATASLSVDYVRSHGSVTNVDAIYDEFEIKNECSPLHVQEETNVVGSDDVHKITSSLQDYENIQKNEPMLIVTDFNSHESDIDAIMKSVKRKHDISCSRNEDTEPTIKVQLVENDFENNSKFDSVPHLPVDTYATYNTNICSLDKECVPASAEALPQDIDCKTNSVEIMQKCQATTDDKERVSPVKKVKNMVAKSGHRFLPFVHYHSPAHETMRRFSDPENGLNSKSQVLAKSFQSENNDSPVQVTATDQKGESNEAQRKSKLNFFDCKENEFLALVQQFKNSFSPSQGEQYSTVYEFQGNTDATKCENMFANRQKLMGGTNFPLKVPADPVDKDYNLASMEGHGSQMRVDISVLEIKTVNDTRQKNDNRESPKTQKVSLEYDTDDRCELVLDNCSLREVLHKKITGLRAGCSRVDLHKSRIPRRPPLLHRRNIILPVCCKESKHSFSETLPTDGNETSSLDSSETANADSEETGSYDHYRVSTRWEKTKLPVEIYETREISGDLSLSACDPTLDLHPQHSENISELKPTDIETERDQQENEKSQRGTSQCKLTSQSENSVGDAGVELEKVKEPMDQSSMGVGGTASAVKSENETTHLRLARVRNADSLERKKSRGLSKLFHAAKHRKVNKCPRNVSAECSGNSGSNIGNSTQTTVTEKNAKGIDHNISN